MPNNKVFPLQYNGTGLLNTAGYGNCKLCERGHM